MIVDRAVGVPLISPVDESILKPVGRAGKIDQVTTGPPPTVGVIEVMAVPFVSTKDV